MAEWLVRYNPQIHDQLVAYLDKEVMDSVRYTQVGVGNMLRLGQPINVFGKRVDLTKDLRERVTEMGTHRFSYAPVKIGEIRITFKSIVDRMNAVIRKPMEKMMELRIKSELKKQFKNNIIEIKRMS